MIDLLAENRIIAKITTILQLCSFSRKLFIPSLPPGTSKVVFQSDVTFETLVVNILLEITFKVINAHRENRLIEPPLSHAEVTACYIFGSLYIILYNYVYYIHLRDGLWTFIGKSAPSSPTPHKLFREKCCSFQ